MPTQHIYIPSMQTLVYTDEYAQLSSANIEANKGKVLTNDTNGNLAWTQLIDSSNLPSYVDDVLEYANFASLPATGVVGKIYICLDTSKSYRWSGSVYIQFAEKNPALNSIYSDHAKVMTMVDEDNGDGTWNTYTQLEKTLYGNSQSISGIGTCSGYQSSFTIGGCVTLSATTVNATNIRSNANTSANLLVLSDNVINCNSTTSILNAVNVTTSGIYCANLVSNNGSPSVNMTIGDTVTTLQKNITCNNKDLTGANSITAVSMNASTYMTTTDVYTTYAYATQNVRAGVNLIGTNIRSNANQASNVMTLGDGTINCLGTTSILNCVNVTTSGIYCTALVSNNGTPGVNMTIGDTLTTLQKPININNHALTNASTINGKTVNSFIKHYSGQFVAPGPGVMQNDFFCDIGYTIFSAQWTEKFGVNNPRLIPTSQVWISDTYTSSDSSTLSTGDIVYYKVLCVKNGE